MTSVKMFHPKKILCPVDMSELSDLALKYAHVGARVFNASLTVLHAMHFDYPRYLSRDLTNQVLAELNDAKASMAQQLANHVHRILGDTSNDPTAFDFKVSDLPPAEAVMQTSAAADTIALAGEMNSDLIVIGAHHQSFGQGTVIGRTTERVLRTAPVPVFSVPHDQTAS